jgi:hypothetical protein
MKDKIRRRLDCLQGDVFDTEMRLIVDAGCHPDCQHMPYCIRCGLMCKAAYDKLKSSRRARK